MTRRIREWAALRWRAWLYLAAVLLFLVGGFVVEQGPWPEVGVVAGTVVLLVATLYRRGDLRYRSTLRGLLKHQRAAWVASGAPRSTGADELDGRSGHVPTRFADQDRDLMAIAASVRDRQQSSLGLVERTRLAKQAWESWDQIERHVAATARSEDERQYSDMLTRRRRRGKEQNAQAQAAAERSVEDLLIELRKIEPPTRLAPLHRRLIEGYTHLLDATRHYNAAVGLEGTDEAVIAAQRQDEARAAIAEVERRLFLPFS